MPSTVTEGNPRPGAAVCDPATRDWQSHAIVAFELKPHACRGHHAPPHRLPAVLARELSPLPATAQTIQPTPDHAYGAKPMELIHWMTAHVDRLLGLYAGIAIVAVALLTRRGARRRGKGR